MVLVGKAPSSKIIEPSFKSIGVCAIGFPKPFPKILAKPKGARTTVRFERIILPFTASREEPRRVPRGGSARPA